MGRSISPTAALFAIDIRCQPDLFGPVSNPLKRLMSRLVSKVAGNLRTNRNPEESEGPIEGVSLRRLRPWLGHAKVYAKFFRRSDAAGSDAAEHPKYLGIPYLGMWDLAP